MRDESGFSAPQMACWKPSSLVRPGGIPRQLLRVKSLGEHLASLNFRVEKGHASVVLQCSKKPHPEHSEPGVKAIFLISPFSTFSCLV